MDITINGACVTFTPGRFQVEIFTPGAGDADPLTTVEWDGRVQGIDICADQSVLANRGYAGAEPGDALITFSSGIADPFDSDEVRGVWLNSDGSVLLEGVNPETGELVYITLREAAVPANR